MGASSSTDVAAGDAANDPAPQRTASDELPASSLPVPPGTSSPLLAHPVRVAEEASEDELLEEEDAGVSSVSSVFTMCNSAIGAGVLSLPYAFRCAGAHLRKSPGSVICIYDMALLHVCRRLSDYSTSCILTWLSVDDWACISVLQAHWGAC